jgi:DNA-binding IclR family transcriptional regulator
MEHEDHTMSSGSYGTRSVDRAAALLVRILESPENLLVGELARDADLPKSTASRLLGALERSGLVRRTEDGGLAPGPAIIRFAYRGISGADLVKLTTESLDRLAEATGETVNVSVSTPQGVEQLAQRDSRHFIGGTNWVGRRLPHHSTSVGKLFLASGAVSVPDEPIRARASTTRGDSKTLAWELEAVRTQGYATAVDELEPGLWAVAAPIIFPDGVIVAALCVSGPTQRLLPGQLEQYGALLVAECFRVSTQLSRLSGVA